MMNNFILSIIAVLLIITMVLSSFYYRDILMYEPDGVEYSCEPLNLKIFEITTNSFNVQWETSDECLGLIKYGTSIDSMNYIALNESSNINKDHLIQLKDLEPASTYYLIIFSDEINYGSGGSPIIVTTNSY